MKKKSNLGKVQQPFHDLAVLIIESVNVEVIDNKKDN